MQPKKVWRENKTIYWTWHRKMKLRKRGDSLNLVKGVKMRFSFHIWNVSSSLFPTMMVNLIFHIVRPAVCACVRTLYTFTACFLLLCLSGIFFCVFYFWVWPSDEHKHTCTPSEKHMEMKSSGRQTACSGQGHTHAHTHTKIFRLRKTLIYHIYIRNSYITINNVFAFYSSLF